MRVKLVAACCHVPGRRNARGPRPHWMSAALLVLVALGMACRTPRAALPFGELVDLTHPFDTSTVYWPTEEGFVLEPAFAGMTDAGYYYAANRFRAAEHGGTHVDAPIHFAAERRTADQIPLAQLVAPGVVIDVSAPCARDRDYAVRVEDLRAWEARHGAIPRGAIVLLRTGFESLWLDRERYLGTAERGPAAVAQLHFPGLGAEAAGWLVEQREIAAVGIDTASIDPGRSRAFESHRVLLEQNVPAFENLANLEELPATGFLAVALPMKIRGGTGAPLRAIAILPAAD